MPENLSRSEFLKRVDKVDNIFADISKTLSRIDKAQAETVISLKALYEALQRELLEHMKDDQKEYSIIKGQMATLDQKINTVDLKIDGVQKKVDRLFVKLTTMIGGVGAASAVIGYAASHFNWF